MGLLSIGLGATEVAAPKKVARMFGVRGRSPGPTILRALGFREIATGVSALFAPRGSTPMWARVVGDAIDLGVLAWMATNRSSNRRRIAIAAAVIAGVTALDVLASRRAAR